VGVNPYRGCLALFGIFVIRLPVTGEFS